jgi:hypothetical protein
MYRLNVSIDQIDECIQQGMFALPYKPKINIGEVLLLQLKKADWNFQGSVGGRIQHALIFQRLENDEDGNVSRKHWPNAGKTWPWIIYSSAVLDVKPFCLEDLPLKRESHYQAQANPVLIDLEDEAIILPYIHWETATPLEEATQKSALGFATNSKDIAAVEKFSVEQSVKELQKWYPSATIEVMKPNNPGFDILVTQMGKVIRYIEVKGTRSSKLLFHLTETERLFSIKNSVLYTLLVVSMIDLVKNTYHITRRDGDIPIGEILQPFQYIGLLKQ